MDLASDYSLMRSVSYFQDSAKCHSGQSSGHVMLNKTALLATQIRHLNPSPALIWLPLTRRLSKSSQTRAPQNRIADSFFHILEPPSFTFFIRPRHKTTLDTRTCQFGTLSGKRPATRRLQCESHHTHTRSNYTKPSKPSVHGATEARWAAPAGSG